MGVSVARVRFPAAIPDLDALVRVASAQLGVLPNFAHLRVKGKDVYAELGMNSIWCAYLLHTLVEHGAVVVDYATGQPETYTPPGLRHSSVRRVSAFPAG